MERILLTATLLFLLVLPAAAALQVSPATKSVVLSNGTDTSYALRIINDQHANLSVSIAAEGELASDVALVPSSFALPAGQAERSVTVNVAVPATAGLAPGDHPVSLRVSALPAGGGGQFGSGIALVHTLVLLKPYEGAYLAGTLRAEGAGPVAFTLSLSNKGHAPTVADGTLAIDGPEGLSGSVPLGNAALAGLSDGKLAGSWAPGALAPGHYAADATVSYDDPVRGAVSASFPSSFVVGHPVAGFAAFRPRLVAGAIARLDLPVTLDWDVPIDAYADVTLLDAENRSVAETTTSTETLDPATTVRLSAFLKTSAASGNYSLQAVVRDARGNVLGRGGWSVPVIGQQLPARRVAASPSIVLVVIALLLLGVATLLWRRRKRAASPPSSGSQ